jgi:rhodanese-related sulfurtransferase
MATTERAAVKTVDPRTLQGWLARGEAMLVDVREPAMHAAERIPGARSVPAGALDPARLEVPAGRRVVLHCEVGVASARAARQLAAAGRHDVYDLAGGIDSWKHAGLPVERDARAPLPIIRQVQIVAGSLVVVGTALGAAVSPWFLLLSGFVGAGLVFAGATGFCGMAALLLRLPHNRRPLAAGRGS